eukprot:7058889-Pyramimonas_sp.AAC.1
MVGGIGNTRVKERQAPLRGATDRRGTLAGLCHRAIVLQMQQREAQAACKRAVEEAELRHQSERELLRMERNPRRSEGKSASPGVANGAMRGPSVTPRASTFSERGAEELEGQLAEVRRPPRAGEG